jgi:DNA-binding NtrC family response regulator
MRPSYQVLIVSERPDIAERVTAWLEGHAVNVASEPTEASRLVAATPLGGLVLDVGGMPNGACRALVREYTMHQPAGRIVILAASEDITTLVSFTFRDPRVDMFFAPWDGKAVRKFLRLAEMPATATV